MYAKNDWMFFYTVLLGKALELDVGNSFAEHTIELTRDWPIWYSVLLYTVE